MKFLISVLIVVLLLNGCSSSGEAAKNAYDKSPSKELKADNLQITIPSGWRKIEDNNDQLFQIWLINDKNNASIGFRSIYLNDLADLPLKEKLNAIEHTLLSKRKSFSDDIELLSRTEYKVNNLNLIELRFLLNEKIQNLLIITNGVRFYECLAYFKNDYSPSTEDIENLLDKQKSIVNDLIVY